MRIVIDIKTDNAAFQDDYATEVTNIIETARRAIVDFYMRDGNLRDSNGNTCGSFKVTGK